MAKIMVSVLVRRGLIVSDVSKNPERCFVSERGDKCRMYLASGYHKNDRPMGVRVERQGSWKVVSTGKVISRYVLPSGGYRYKCEGVLFLTTLEEALVQAGLDVSKI